MDKVFANYICMHVASIQQICQSSEFGMLIYIQSIALKITKCSTKKCNVTSPLCDVPLFVAYHTYVWC